MPKVVRSETLCSGTLRTKMFRMQANAGVACSVSVCSTLSDKTGRCVVFCVCTPSLPPSLPPSLSLSLSLSLFLSLCVCMFCVCVCVLCVLYACRDENMCVVMKRLLCLCPLVRFSTVFRKVHGCCPLLGVRREEVSHQALLLATECLVLPCVCVSTPTCLCFQLTHPVCFCNFV